MHLFAVSPVFHGTSPVKIQDQCAWVACPYSCVHVQTKAKTPFHSFLRHIWFWSEHIIMMKKIDSSQITEWHRGSLHCSRIGQSVLSSQNNSLTKQNNNIHSYKRILIIMIMFVDSCWHHERICGPEARRGWKVREQVNNQFYQAKKDTWITLVSFQREEPWWSLFWCWLASVDYMSTLSI